MVQVNEDNNQVIPYHRFYVPDLKNRVNIRNDYLSWVQQAHQAQQMGGLLTQVAACLSNACTQPFLKTAYRHIGKRIALCKPMQQWISVNCH